MKIQRILNLLFVLLLMASNAHSATFEFVVMADSRGDSDGVNDTILSNIVSLISQGNASFVIFPGDLVTGSTTESILTSQLNHWRKVMAPLYAKNTFGAKVYAGPGNHEISSSGSEVVWQTVFSDLPFNGPLHEKYMTYSFDYQNSHFIMLDTDRVGLQHTINYDWLAADLASTTAEHIFVFGHEPAYPVGPHLGSSLDTYSDQRDTFWQLLAHYKVDIFFAGHEHLYNHIKLDGVQQIISGTCGAPISGGYGGDFYHYAKVTVEEQNVSLEIIDDRGELRDHFCACTEDPIWIEGTNSYFAVLQSSYDSTTGGGH
jgi:predicted phosphodiesterase